MSKIIKEPIDNTKPAYPRKTLITIMKLSEILEDIIKESEENDIIQEELAEMKAFSCKKPPHISVLDYLKRIVKYGQPSYSSLLLALIYIDKLIETKELLLSSLNIHRLLMACIVVSIKYNEDEYYSNTFYAKVAGISVEELNCLEYSFIKAIDFELYVSDEEFRRYTDYLDEDFGLNAKEENEGDDD